MPSSCNVTYLQATDTNSDKHTTNPLCTDVADWTIAFNCDLLLTEHTLRTSNINVQLPRKFYLSKQGIFLTGLTSILEQ